MRCIRTTRAHAGVRLLPLRSWVPVRNTLRRPPSALRTREFQFQVILGHLASALSLSEDRAPHLSRFPPRTKDRCQNVPKRAKSCQIVPKMPCAQSWPSASAIGLLARVFDCDEDYDDEDDMKIAPPTKPGTLATLAEPSLMQPCTPAQLFALLLRTVFATG